MSARPENPGHSIEVGFTLNGSPQTVNVEPFARLSRVLRDELGHTGTKVGCDAGDCGACTVSLDGRQVCACLVSAAQADGAVIETVEDSRNDVLLNGLRSAFLQHGAAQCGICTPGMLMAARDLLRRRPNAMRDEIEDAIGGVLCRCTGYLKIVEAVQAVAAGAIVKPEAPASGEAVGARIARVDGLPKVNGTDLFGADEAPVDALWLRVIRSPHARARFTLGDFQPLYDRFPGLTHILTEADVPGAKYFGIYPDLKDQPVLAIDQVRYRGEAVVALVGDRAVVEAIPTDMLPIAWQPEDPVTGVTAATAPAAPAVHEAKPDNVLISGFVECGDVERACSDAAAAAEYEIHTGFVEHAYIEPEAGYAQPLPNGRVEVVACTQAPYMDRDEVANVLGIDPTSVRIKPTACGGGFGGKLDVSLQPILAVAALHLGRPVRTVYSRVESMASSTKRHPAHVRGRIAADADGNIVAYESNAEFNTGAYASWGPTVAGRVPVHAAGPYAIPNVRNRSRAIYTNETPAGAFRGFGIPQAALVNEGLIDEVADKLGIDRLEIRHRNALRAGDRTATGQVLEASCGLAECLDALREDWTEMLARAAEHNANDPTIRRGVGIGCMWYGCGNTSLSNPSTMKVTLERDGRLTLFNGAADIGQGSTTVILQICADALGLPVEDFDLVIGDTDRTADAGKSSASRQTFVSGKAAYLAGRDLREKILAAAEAEPDATLRLTGSNVYITEQSIERTLALDKYLGAGDSLDGHGRYDPPTTPLDEKGQGIPYATYGFAAQICELEVDMELGTVNVIRIVAAHDVGRSINPTLVEGQVHGGIAQGLGLALMEEFVPGVTENLHDYLIPTVGDMPAIDVYLIEDPEPEGPYGAKGVGEPALVPTPAAILGAIRDATGVRLDRVPALPHRVRAAIVGRQ